MEPLSIVATRASNLKANPAARWAAFQRLCEKVDTSEALDDLAVLYKTFAPKPKRTKYTNRFDWLALATASTSDARHYLRYVQVSKYGAAVSTDGHRLHVTTLDDRDAGYYDSAGAAVEMDDRYPDVARVLRECMTDDLVPLSDVLGDVRLIGDGNKAKPEEAQILRLGGEDVGLNKRYLADATLGTDPANVRVGQKVSGQGVYLSVGRDRLAVVMPIRL